MKKVLILVLILISLFLLVRSKWFQSRLDNLGKTNQLNLSY